MQDKTSLRKFTTSTAAVSSSRRIRGSRFLWTAASSRCNDRRVNALAAVKFSETEKDQIASYYLTCNISTHVVICRIPKPAVEDRLKVIKNELNNLEHDANDIDIFFPSLSVIDRYVIVVAGCHWHSLIWKLGMIIHIINSQFHSLKSHWLAAVARWLMH